MQYLLRYGLVVVALSACTGDRPKPGPVASTETRLYTYDSVTSYRDFRRAVIGQSLKGDGVEMTVREDGELIGIDRGRPFVGGWTYDDGVFCVSTAEIVVRRADDRRCYRLAVSGREIYLDALVED